MSNEDYMLDVESATNSERSFKNDKRTYCNVAKASRLIVERLHSLLSQARYEKKFRWHHLSLATKIIFALAASSTLSAYPFPALTHDYLHPLTKSKGSGLFSSSSWLSVDLQRSQFPTVSNRLRRIGQTPARLTKLASNGHRSLAKASTWYQCTLTTTTYEEYLYSMR